jgi:galactoside O-acetyltransferase
LEARERSREILILKVFRKLRNLFLGIPLGVSIGRNINFKSGSLITFGKNIKLGHDNILTAVGGKIVFNNHFSSNDRVIFNADIGGTLSFGENCLVGPACIFRTANHVYENPNLLIREQGHEVLDITVGNDVWFGANVLVLPGVSIGNGCVVGAGSVVTRSFEDYSIIAGVPARVIGKR